MNKNSKVFISSPMSSFENDEVYQIFRREVLNLAEYLSNQEYVDEVFYAGQEMNSGVQFDSPKDAFDLDIAKLRSSGSFVILYPHAVASSSLIELGIAIEMKIPITILTPSRTTLPYMVQEIDKNIDSSTIIEVPELRNLTTKIVSNHQLEEVLFPI